MYEEVLIHVTFPELDQSDYISKSSISFDVDSLFTSEPKCFIKGFQYYGRYEMTLGTDVFFKDGCDSNSSNTFIHNEDDFKLEALCNKSLIFELKAIPDVMHRSIEGSNKNQCNPQNEIVSEESFEKLLTPVKKKKPRVFKPKLSKISSNDPRVESPKPLDLEKVDENSSLENVNMINEEPVLVHAYEEESANNYYYINDIGDLDCHPSLPY